MRPLYSPANYSNYPNMQYGVLLFRGNGSAVGTSTIFQTVLFCNLYSIVIKKILLAPCIFNCLCNVQEILVLDEIGGCDYVYVLSVDCSTRWGFQVRVVYMSLVLFNFPVNEIITSNKQNYLFFIIKHTLFNV